MLCPSSLVLALLVLALASSLLSVHTSPCHRVRHRNFICGMQMHIGPPFMYIKYLVIFTFKRQPLWYFSLICCPAHTDSHRDFMLYILTYLLFTFIHKRNNVTVTYFLKFMSIFLKFMYSFISSRHLNFMCFDI